MALSSISSAKTANSYLKSACIGVLITDSWTELLKPISPPFNPRPADDNDDNDDNDANDDDANDADNDEADVDADAK